MHWADVFIPSMGFIFMVAFCAAGIGFVGGFIAATWIAAVDLRGLKRRLGL